MSGKYFSFDVSIKDLEQAKLNIHTYGRIQEIIARCQFTGLHDKNGKEIYDGDIVEFIYWWFDGAERDTVLTGTIMYSPELMSFQLKGVKNEEWEQFTGYENDSEYLTPFSELNFSEAEFEIIGNIHSEEQVNE